MNEELKAYYEAKKLNSLMHSTNAKKLLTTIEYKNYLNEHLTLEKILIYLISYKEKNLVDDYMKKNLYEISQILRFETEYKNKEEKTTLFKKANDLIRLTNSSDGENADELYFHEYIKRIDKIVHPKNESNYRAYYESVGKEAVKASIENDFYFLFGIISEEYKYNFKEYIVPELLVSEEFLYSMNAMIKENKEFFMQTDVNEKIKYILNNSMKLMLGLKTIYEKEENDKTSLNKIITTKKILTKIK